MLFIKNKMTPREKKQLEDTQVELARQNAKSDYIAMMADIDIPEEESENEQEV